MSVSAPDPDHDEAVRRRGRSHSTDHQRDPSDGATLGRRGRPRRSEFRGTLTATPAITEVAGACHSERGQRVEEPPEAQSDAQFTRTFPPSGDPSTRSSNSLAQGAMEDRTARVSGTATRNRIRSHGEGASLGVPGPALCRYNVPAGKAPCTMPRPGSLGQNDEISSPGSEGGRRRAIGVVAALQLLPRGTTPMVRRRAAKGDPEGRC